MDEKDKSIEFVIFGEPASKANQRKAVMFGKRPAFIKSDKARAYAEQFRTQCPVLEKPFEGDVHLDLVIYYASRRPDLDESLILDLMQTDRKTGKKYIYVNDRQVKSRFVQWALDPTNPRTEIRVTSYEVPANRMPPASVKKRKTGR
jgi:hypothetical protein